MIKKYLPMFFLFVLVSCKNDTKIVEVKKIVAEWIGKEVVLPSDARCIYLDRDTICPNKDTPYKILLYADSTGCTTCKLQLNKWKDFIEEVENSMSDQVSFHFYFQPKDEKELKFLLKTDLFKHTVYIDKNNKLDKANRFPSDINYQCFLLDKNNKVILIGNPTLSPAIWELYKKTITGNEGTQQKKNILTTIEVEESEIELINTKVNETSIATFILKNTGENPLVIKNISVSCGCTVPEWDKKPIKPGDTTEIKVKVTFDNKGNFRKTITVFCNTKNNSIRLTVKSEVMN